MLAFAGVYVRIVTDILGWSSFLCAVVVAWLLLHGKKGRVAPVACLLYAVAFLVVRFCFVEVYFQCAPTVTILALLVCVIWSSYEDKVNGKRWWN